MTRRNYSMHSNTTMTLMYKDRTWDEQPIEEILTPVDADRVATLHIKAEMQEGTYTDLRMIFIENKNPNYPLIRWYTESCILATVDTLSRTPAGPSVPSINDNLKPYGNVPPQHPSESFKTKHAAGQKSVEDSRKLIRSYVKDEKDVMEFTGYMGKH